MAEDISKLGSLLAMRRQLLCLTQEELANKICVETDVVNYLEQGKIMTLELVKEVAQALEITVRIEIQAISIPDNDELFFMMMAISKFAHHHDITRKAAVLYLVRYKGIEFLEEFYRIEKTLSFDDCIEDLTKVCSNNGGGLKYELKGENEKKLAQESKADPTVEYFSKGKLSFSINTTDYTHFDVVIDFRTSDLTRFLMEDHKDMTLMHAIIAVHTSEWYEKVSNSKTYLYVESSGYNYDLLKHELTYGKLY